MALDLSGVVHSLPTPEVYAQLKDIPGFSHYHHVGSSVFMEDAKDEDYVVVLAPFHASEAHSYLLTNGWEDCSAENYQMGGDWKAFRKGRLNFIICADPVWAQKFANAAQVCAFLGIRDKETRCKLNWIIRDDWSAGAAKAQRYEEN